MQCFPSKVLKNNLQTKAVYPLASKTYCWQILAPKLDKSYLSKQYRSMSNSQVQNRLRIGTDIAANLHIYWNGQRKPIPEVFEG